MNAWRGFKEGNWQNNIDVTEFIRLNYTEYLGDDSFLEGPTEATTELWKSLSEKFKVEREKGIYDAETKIPSQIDAYGAGYINKDLEKIVGLQTDAPLKRAIFPNGGLRMVKNSLEAFGYELDPETEEIFTKYRKTHNDGVFSAYTEQIRKARRTGIITGLPDAYGRGRIIGDYRRVVLYGVDRLISDRQKELLNLDPAQRYVAMLVGSRGSEVEFLSEPFLQTAQLLHQRYPDVKFLVPLINQKRRQQFEQIKQRVAPELDMILLDGNARAAMITAEATLLASGTAALEAMLCKSPMVVGYRMKPFTYFLAKRLVKTKYVSLPNLLADEMLVPELIQEDCNPTNLAEKLSLYLSEDKSAVQNRHVLLQRFAELHQRIQCNADQQAAQAVIDLLEPSHG